MILPILSYIEKSILLLCFVTFLGQASFAQVAYLPTDSADDCEVILDNFESDKVICDCDQNGTEVLFWELPKAHGTEKCGPVKATQSSGFPLGTTRQIGEYEIGYLLQAVDREKVAIVSAPYTFKVVVKPDDVDPVITNSGSDVMKNVKSTVNSSGVYLIPDVTNLVKATDNCSIANITQSPEAGSTFSKANRKQLVIVTVKDKAGNSTTCEVELASKR